MSKSEYFDGVGKVSSIDFLENEWSAWFFAECSRLAYRNELRARKEFRRIGFTTYNFYSVEGAQVHIVKNSESIDCRFFFYLSRKDSHIFLRRDSREPKCL